MVEIFKTNVNDRDQAQLLLTEIHKAFSVYKANFDLEDCDKILRVKCTEEIIQPSSLIAFLENFGCSAEVIF
ncbi:MAG: hypothetical protein JWP12_826 [Bacteroidetes bacterium]|nr:hypothetical protein [Bacteroidota bacterium]